MIPLGDPVNHNHRYRRLWALAFDRLVGDLIIISGPSSRVTRDIMLHVDKCGAI